MLGLIFTVYLAGAFLPDWYSGRASTSCCPKPFLFSVDAPAGLSGFRACLVFPLAFV